MTTEGHGKSVYGGECDKEDGKERKAHICSCRTSLWGIRIEHGEYLTAPSTSSGMAGLGAKAAQVMLNIKNLQRPFQPITLTSRTSNLAAATDL